MRNNGESSTRSAKRLAKKRVYSSLNPRITYTKRIFTAKERERVKRLDALYKKMADNFQIEIGKHLEQYPF